MTIKIGVMQGRLSDPIHNTIQAFPEDTWENEFGIAKEIGLDCIEWIFDTSCPNPILTNEGRVEIKELSKNNDISINSICADYFMVKKLFSELELDI